MTIIEILPKALLGYYYLSANMILPDDAWHELATAHDSELPPLAAHDRLEMRKAEERIETTREVRTMPLLVEKLVSRLNSATIYKPLLLLPQKEYEISQLKSDYKDLNYCLDNPNILARYQAQEQNAFLGLRQYYWECCLYEKYCVQLKKASSLHIPFDKLLDPKDTRIKLTISKEEIRLALSPLLGKNLDGRTIMSEADFEYFLHANFEGFFPQKPIIPMIANLSKGNLRFFFYQVHIHYSLKTHSAHRIVEMLHKNFPQFGTAFIASTKKNFSKEPANYHLGEPSINCVKSL